jgi:hypothetical protein
VSVFLNKYFTRYFDHLLGSKEDTGLTGDCGVKGDSWPKCDKGEIGVENTGDIGPKGDIRGIWVSRVKLELETPDLIVIRQTWVTIKAYFSI